MTVTDSHRHGPCIAKLKLVEPAEVGAPKWSKVRPGELSVAGSQLIQAANEVQNA